MVEEGHKLPAVVPGSRNHTPIRDGSSLEVSRKRKPRVRQAHAGPLSDILMPPIVSSSQKRSILGRRGQSSDQLGRDCILEVVHCSGSREVEKVGQVRLNSRGERQTSAIAPLP